MDQQQQNSLQQLQDLVTNANEILVTTREFPSIDGLCSALALYHAFSGQRALNGKQKKVTLAISSRQGTQYTLLPGSDKIVSELGLRDLVIALNGYVDNSIENVNWYVDHGKLNVVFKANPAVPMQFDLKNLDPFYAGANFDAVFVVDAVSPQDLGNLYRQDPGMFAELPVINISNKQNNSRFGKVNIVDPQVASVSELTFQLLQIVRASLVGDVAALLLLGINDATNRMQNKGPQTDGIVNQLQGLVSRQLDLDAIRNQANNQTLPIMPTTPNQLNQGYPGQYPQMGAMNPQYPGQQPPMAYPPMQYPQYPAQPQQYGGYPYPQPPMNNQPVPPAYGNPYYQQPNYPAATPAQIPPQTPNLQEQYEYNQMNNQALYGEEIPSIQHDATPYSNYIPTVEPMGQEHVDPALSTMQNVQTVGEYEEAAQQNDDNQQNVAATVGESKLDKTEKDMYAPPKIFSGGGGGERSKG